MINGVSKKQYLAKAKYGIYYYGLLKNTRSEEIYPSYQAKEVKYDREEEAPQEKN